MFDRLSALPWIETWMQNVRVGICTYAIFQFEPAYSRLGDTKVYKAHSFFLCKAKANYFEFPLYPTF